VKTRVLITGGLGFVGRYLYGELLQSGYDVWASDLASACDHFGPPLDPGKVRACDVASAEDVLALLNTLKPDIIVHLAAQSSSSRAFAQPRETFLTNAVGTFNLFEAVCSSCPASSVLVVGSAEIYGPQASAGLLTEESALLPVSPYALSKATQDLIALQYGRSHGLTTFRTRSFNHTGPGQNTAFALPSFAFQIAQAEAGLLEPVIEVGNLDVVRDFLDVRDVVRAYRSILEKGKPGAAYNVCSGKAASMEALLQLLLSFSRVKITVKKVESRVRPADIPYLVGDNLRLVAHTGWQPRCKMEQTLSELLDFWRKKVEESSNSSMQRKEIR
jgi:GDP-4-dehydro-6-deoxy-D-mannose reductase